MVKFRGIEISIISQFDIHRLPEYGFRQTSPSPDQTHARQHNAPASSKATASCYVPIYPGSQIWFEYSIDGPHPPTAAYFFKLLFNGSAITSFDCGSKHRYHGKVMYNLVAMGIDELTGGVNMMRQALHFSSELEPLGSQTAEDVIEFRVHRIEHRKRLGGVTAGIGASEDGLNQNAKLQLRDGGILEPGFPKRRYKYQLLDPVDEPYATFQFFCRSHEYLEQRGITNPSTRSPPSSLYSIDLGGSSSSSGIVNAASQPYQCEDTSRLSSFPEFTVKMVASASDTAGMSKESGTIFTLDKHNSMTSDTYLPPSDSDDELSVVTRDSVEYLPCTVARSPRSPRFQALGDDDDDGTLVATTPTLASPRSPRRRLKKKLTVSINGFEFDLEQKKRSMSPFTHGGILRKFVPPSAPAAMTEFGPSIYQEAEAKIDEAGRRAVAPESMPVRTTRAERSGRSLIGFLSRRAGNT